MKSGSKAYQFVMSGLRRARGAAKRHPIMLGGTAFGIGTIGAAGYGAYKFEQTVARAAEADQMARMILTAQSGPFGPSGRLVKTGPNMNNTAGLTLAAHYARNRNKRFGLLGLRYL